MEGLLERHGALLERVAQLERALEKIARMSGENPIRSMAQAALEGER
jgi:hypothetical protein